MDWCRVVGPRGLCRPLDENKQPGPSHPVRATRRANTGQGAGGRGQGAGGRGQGAGGRGRGAGGRGQGAGGRGQGAGGRGQGAGGRGQGRAGAAQGSAERAGGGGLAGRAGAGRAGQSTDDINGGGFGVLLYCLTAKKSFAGRRHCSPRIPGGFTLPHRFVETLGRGPRSEPRAPMQMVSGALGSLGFKV